ncbi:MAG: ArsR/SmtB family transcription factor [Verrucomicrobium sp.]
MSKKTPEPAGADAGDAALTRAALFAALGDATRLSLVTTLASGQPRSVSQLAEGYTLTRQAISKHLGILEDVGLVHSVRAGRESLYALDPGPMRELRTYLEQVSEQWDLTLGRLKAFVEEG